MKAVVIRDYTSLEDVTNFQAILGGWLEALPVGENFTVFIDEDGKSKGLQPNPQADRVIRAMLTKVERELLMDDFIVGPAIFVGIDGDGNEVDLPQEVIAEFFPELI